MKKQLLVSILFLLFANASFGQRGKDGAKTITTSEVVNAYTTLTADATAGATSISVTNSNLNTNFSGNLSQGDLIMIIQIQGVSVEDTINTVFVNSSKFFDTWGRITDYNNCGNHEFVQVISIPNATTINFDCALQYDYTEAGKVLIIRVPRFSSLTINSGGTLTTTPWNSTSGGVIAVEVDGLTSINSGGSIDASGLGFRGGVAINFSQNSPDGLRFADSNPLEGGEKGEGIYGDQSDYDLMNGGGARYSRGAAANAGGGGISHNAGGGGGSNAGNTSNWNNGVGVPDPTHNAAWSLETPSISGLISSGGGRGGYSQFAQNNDPLITPPGVGNGWGGHNRQVVGGLGGRPLDYSTGKIFMSGGGGAGEGNDTQASDGGNGAGIIYLTTYGNITGGGQILANGANGEDVIGTNPGFNSLKGKDAAGGAGGGGTVILQTTGTVSLTGTIDANGGIGGDQVLVADAFYGAIDEGEGPGGGGGGGYIAISAGTPTRNTNGGISGVTNCPYVSNFPPNGATGGGTGLPNENINSFDIVVNDVTICTNNDTTLTATLSGNPPAGTSIEWYDAQFGGTLLFTGSSYMTPILTATTTYWVKVCPAPYLVPVTVTISSCTGVSADFSSSDSTLCIGDCIDFTDLSTGIPTGWTWYFPGAATTTSSDEDPTNICYTTANTYDVSLVVTDGINTDSLYMPGFISVINCVPLASFTPSATTICAGDSITFTDNSTGINITGWSWTFPGGTPPTDNTQGPHTVIFSTPGTYNVNLSITDSLGVDDSTIVITVNNCNVVTAAFTISDTTICNGDSTIFTDASFGGVTGWQWNFDLTGIGGVTPPTTNTQGPHTVFYNTPGTYTIELIVTDGFTSDTTTRTIVVSDCSPTANFAAIGNTTFCEGDSISFNDLSTGSPTGWSWSFPGGTPATFIGQNPGFITYPTAGTYSVTLTVTNQYGTDSITLTNVITVIVCSAPTPSITMDDTDGEICVNNCINFSYAGTGGTPTTINWTFDGGTPSSSTALNPGMVCWGTSGTFNVIVTASNTYGSSSDTTVIIVHEEPTVFAGLDTTIIIGNDGHLYAVVTDPAGNVVTGGTFAWSPTLLLSCINCQNPTVAQPFGTSTYTVTYTDQYGCVVSDDVVINVDINLNVGIPSAFSPNGDGSNDLLLVKGKEAIETLNFTIYNRYGQEVFSTIDVDEGWDGTQGGKELNPGVFVYYANITLIDGSIMKLKGNVTLVR